MYDLRFVVYSIKLPPRILLKLRAPLWVVLFGMIVVIGAFGRRNTSTHERRALCLYEKIFFRTSKLIISLALNASFYTNLP